jgi:hypothetical protein
MPKRLLLKIGFSLLLLCLLAGALEGGYRLLARGGALVWKKNWIQTVKGFGNCYSHDPEDRYRLDLRTMDDPVTWVHSQNLAHAIMAGDPPPPAPMTKEALLSTPHCIIYTDQRERGFFPERKDKVLLLGDSFTFGEGLRDQETLGYLLGKQHHRFDFLNLGVSGADADHTASIFSAAMQKQRGKAKLAIYFFYPNDAVALDEAVPPESVAPTTEALDGMWRNLPGSRLLAWSRLARAVFDNRTRNRLTETYMLEIERYYQATNYGMKDTRDALERMARLSKDEKIPLLLVIYPFLYHTWTGDYPLTRAHAWVLKTCEELGLRCLDGHLAFADERNLSGYQLNPADAHPNLAANTRMVTFLEPTITGILNKKR